MRLRGAAFAIVTTWVCCSSLAAAAPPTKDECFNSNEEAQTLRRSKKLRSARERLLRCVSPACPAAVRDDCAERLDEIERALPTIVFTVKSGGNDVRDVQVTVDGAPLADRLDGTGLVVDPGEHVFGFVANGYPPVTKTFVIGEGAKDRNEVIEITAAEPATRGRTQPAAGDTAPPEEGEDRGKGRRLFALGLGGVGIVGIGLGAFFALQSKSTYDDALSHCPNGPKSCTQAGVSGGDDAHAQATVATVAFIAGGALLATGAVLYLTAPKKHGVGLRPTLAPTFAGLDMGGTW